MTLCAVWVFELTPEDERTHTVEPAVGFSESMYANFADPDGGLAGFFRVGNRPNQGVSEATACLYLPDGAVGFSFDRPPCAGNEALDAGGIRFDVAQPLEQLRIFASGQLAILRDPLALANPRRALSEAQRLPYRATLSLEAISPVARVASGANRIMAEFARNHYEQHVSARGSVACGDDEWHVDGYGLRDHSWGPRSWQSFLWYRWLTGNFGTELGFMFTQIRGRDGTTLTSGLLRRGKSYAQVDALELSTEYSADDNHYPHRLRVVAAADERRFEISGEILSLVPLRHRSRDAAKPSTRICEGRTRWSYGEQIGYGMSEYLDLIVDERPAGATEERR